MSFCWMCFNGWNQGGEACSDCGREGHPLEPWMSWYLLAVLLIATLVTLLLPKLGGLHPTTVQTYVLGGVLPFLLYLVWKMR